MNASSRFVVEGNVKKNRPSHLTLFNPFQKFTLGIISVDGANHLIQTTTDRMRSAQ